MSALEEKLLANYPKLFSEDRNDPTKNLMCFGMECGDGWYEILDRAFEKMYALPEIPVLMQVKEKFGTLRIYLAGYSDDAEKIVDEAETASEITCEECGAPGKINKNGWMSVRCDKHRREEDE